MASWTNLTDAILTIGKPLTYVIARAWRDNAIAIAEGAVGAPRVVVPTAISTAETNTQKTLRPNGSGGVTWDLSPSAPNVVLLITASGTVSIPIGTRIKVTVIGGGGGSTGTAGSNGTAGGDSTATDGAVTITGGGGGFYTGGNGTSSGGTGYTILNDGGTNYGHPGNGPVGGIYGKGGTSGNSTTPANAGGGNGGSARVVIFVMAAGTLTLTAGAAGAAGGGANAGKAGNAGAVIVEY